MKVRNLSIVLMCLLSASSLVAQVGINTENPQGVFHIDATRDNSASPTPVQITNDVVVTASGDMGLGTLAPGAKLEIAGQTKITGGNPAEGRVLTSDADGLASWQPPMLAMAYFVAKTYYPEIQPVSNKAGGMAYHPFVFKPGDKVSDNLTVDFGMLNAGAWSIDGKAINQVNTYFDLPMAGTYRIEVFYSPVADIFLEEGNRIHLLFKNLIIAQAPAGSTSFAIADVNRTILRAFYDDAVNNDSYFLNSNPTSSYFIISVSAPQRITVVEWLLDDPEYRIVDSYRFATPSGANKLYNLAITKVF